jgi:iron complex outermembrane recepter protein
MKKYLVLFICIVSVLYGNNTDIGTIEISGEDIYETSRKDIDIGSITNLYRVEKTAQFGTEVITKEEIEEQNPKDIFDLLNKATGLDLTYQGRKKLFFVNMRGGGDITYILDGAILPSSTGDRILYKIPLIAIEEIQIVRSSTALTIAPSIDIGASNSGSGTKIGFIIIRTKQPKKTEAILSAYTEKASGHPSANGESLYLGSIFDVTSEFNGYAGGMLSRFDKPSQNEWFDGSEAYSGFLNAGINYKGLHINMMSYKDKGNMQMQKGVDTHGVVSDVEWYYDPIKTRLFSLDGNMKWNKDQTTLFSLSNLKYEQTEHSSSDKTYEEESQTYSLRHNMQFNDTLIQLGAQLSRSKGLGANLSKAYNKYDTSVFGYAISAEQSFLDNDLIFNAGYRKDQKKIKNSVAERKESDYLAHLDVNNDVDLAPANVYVLGALYNINERHKINFRYMKANEGIGGDFDLETQDDEKLHEEKQDRWEVALEGKYTKAINTMLTYFDVDIQNEKTATSNTYTDNEGNEYYYYTESDVHRKGIEFMLNGLLTNSTRYKFSWTRMLDNITDDEDEIGISTPRDLFTASLNHSWDSYNFNISAKKVSAYTSSSSAKGTATDVDLGDYTTVDANIAKNFVFNKLDATCKIYGRNITDEQYSTRYVTGYYYDRGRTLGIELTLKF